MTLSKQSDTDRWAATTRGLASTRAERDGWRCQSITFMSGVVAFGVAALLLNRIGLPVLFSSIFCFLAFGLVYHVVGKACRENYRIDGIKPPAQPTVAPRAKALAASKPKPAPKAAPKPAPATAAKPDPKPEPEPAPAAMPEPEPAEIAGSRPAALESAREGGPDDLTRIKGIGPKLAKLCHSLGFYHFDQIAGWTESEIAWVDDNLTGFKGRVTRDDWVGQAKALASESS
ncbi:MAG: hypothetical protein AAF415_14020 [Pseudomonadota bacterium]